jgi:voltage-gated potassium channel
MTATAGMRHRTPYQKMRRRVYHMLGGEGHNDLWVKVVDMALVSLISINCIFSILETVQSLSVVHGHIFHDFDICSVLIFSVEYVLRVWTAVEMEDSRFHHPVFGRLRYMLTPLALVDLVAILPFYFGIFFEVDLRAMRVLRLLRVFKLTRYSQAMTVMVSVLRQEARAIGAVLFVFGVILVFIASLMYLLEHPAQPLVFSDIPAAMWWTVVTMTTLGYGDMIPITALGRVVGGFTAILGVGMIALPAGVLASGFGEQLRLRREEYMETVEKAVHQGQLTRGRRRHLEETRQALGLSHEEASRILEQVVNMGSTDCPNCGHKVGLRPEG